MNLLQRQEIISECVSALGRMELVVRQETDLDVAFDKICAIREKGSPSPLLNPKTNLFTRGNSLFLFAERADGEPVIGGVARFDDVLDQPFSEYLPRFLEAVFGQKVSNRPHLKPPELGGRLVYFGDLRAEKGSEFGVSANHKQALRLYNFVAHHYTQLAFKPDYTYCFIDRRHMSIGADFNYSFFDRAAFPYVFEKPAFRSGSPDWLVYLPRQRMNEMYVEAAELTGQLVAQFPDKKQEFSFHPTVTAVS